MSELDDLEAYATPETVVDLRQAYKRRNWRNYAKNAKERHAMRQASMRRRDQEIFDRMGLPKGSGT
jgi:hypothetical protein